MKNLLSKIINNKKVISALSLCLISVSTFGANTQCVCIFHDVEKPLALGNLKKF